MKYKSVHLAIDPEWHTPTPGLEIGSVTAAEINDAQALMQDYLEEQGIEGERALIVHQFNWRMIKDRHLVKTDFEQVRLIHNADGFGPPEDKYKSWEYNTRADNIPLKGFKLFYSKEWLNTGYDDPLLSPEEVLALNPEPVLIMYQ